MCLVWALCESTYVDINKTTDIILVLVWIEFHDILTYSWSLNPLQLHIYLGKTKKFSTQPLPHCDLSSPAYRGTLESPYLTQPLLISAALAEGSWVLYSHAVGQSKVKSSLKFSVSALSLHPVVCLLWSVLQKQIWLRNISDLVCSARVKKQFFLGFYFLTISVLAYS